MQGTAEHEASAECLIHGYSPNDYLGRSFVFLPNREEMWLEQLPVERRSEIVHTIIFDDEALDRVNAYVGYVRDLVNVTGGVLLVEQRVPIDHITGEVDAGGTSDAIVMTAEEVIVCDYKSGQGRVEAHRVLKPAGIDIITGCATPAVLGPNLQLAKYASGVLRKYGWMVPDAKRVRLVIVQPRLNAIDEYSLSVQDLNATIAWISQKAEETRNNPQFNPTVDNCQFCPGKVDCQPREKAALEIALEGFTQGDCQSLIAAKPRQIEGQWLGVLFDKLDMLDAFIKDVRTRVFHELAAGHPVVNSEGEPLKLVEGRGGHRQWSMEQMAKELLIRMGLREDQVFDISLRSPADIEKLTKAKRQGKGLPMLPPVIKGEQWSALSTLIQKPPGKPAIAKASDERPAITPKLDGFIDLSTVEDDQET